MTLSRKFSIKKWPKPAPQYPSTEKKREVMTLFKVEEIYLSQDSPQAVRMLMMLH